MKIHKTITALTVCFSLTLLLPTGFVAADPCGMVPPIYTGPGSAIARTGLQQTYVFFNDGVESFVIRPAFTGKVDNFGMLIPFPTPPAIRKVADNVFDQIKNAIDPPEVVIDLRPQERFFALGAGGGGAGGVANNALKEGKDENRLEVLNEEAVGMYEVAVLSAGSAKALKKWMDQNGFQYPNGMDKVTNDYVKSGWCFVAVKTRVGPKAGVDPHPGQRAARPVMPAGSTFDGAVQALGFRFRTKKLVVPMRLSAFNDGQMRNIVYLLARGAKKIRAIPEEYVVRQISGKQLVKNLTSPVPLRIIGGKPKDIGEGLRASVDDQRKPGQYNGVAKSLFASDIRASELDEQTEQDLTLAHETTEKELLKIGERFGLRGPDIDTQIANVVSLETESFVDSTMGTMRQMMLTVVDGDFPREVVANQNLTFARFNMPAAKNSAKFYDAKLHGPAAEKQGQLFTSTNPWKQNSDSTVQNVSTSVVAAFGIMGLFLLAWPAARSIQTQQSRK